ncbi:MAG TPA: acetyltransferase [Bryobacteraceae bacterium]|jgi:hypothetical protein
MIARFLIAVLSLSAAGIRGQTLMEGPAPGESPFLLPSDAAVLEGREPRHDVGCSLTPLAPKLGFDLAYHAGYEAAIPLRDLGEGRSALTVIFRVIPGRKEEKPVYFSQKWIVPPIDAEAKGTALLRGDFVLGEGNYEIDWLIRDPYERFCSAYWRVLAESRGRNKSAELSVRPGSVQPETSDLFSEEAPVKRESKSPLHVLVLVHLAPRSPGAAAMPPDETQALVAILRNIAREPRIGSYSVAAFNLEQRETVYRSARASQIDFPSLGAAVKQMHLGAIDVRKLQTGDNGIQFVTSLIAAEVETEPPDAIIFVGVKSNSAAPAIRNSLSAVGESRPPVFYLTYNADPAADPWRDTIGSIVKRWKGFEYTVTRPRDLLTAWPDVMARLARKENTRNSPLSSDTINGLVPKK